MGEYKQAIQGVPRLGPFTFCTHVNERFGYGGDRQRVACRRFRNRKSLWAPAFLLAASVSRRARLEQFALAFCVLCYTTTLFPSMHGPRLQMLFPGLTERRPPRFQA